MNYYQPNEEQISNPKNLKKIIKGNRRLVREKALQILMAHFVSATDINLLIEHIFDRHFIIDDEKQTLKIKMLFENDEDDENEKEEMATEIRLLSEEELQSIDSDATIQWRAEDVKFGMDIIFAVIKNYDKFVEYIKEASMNWDFDRIAIIDRIAIMIASAEFIFAPDVPVKVSINEALELAKTYSTDKSTMFVNGMLEKIKSILEEKKQINKSPRGLK